MKAVFKLEGKVTENDLLNMNSSAFWKATSDIASTRMKHPLKRAYGIYWKGSQDKEWAERAKESYLTISRRDPLWKSDNMF